MARRISQSRHRASPRFRCGLPHLRISSHFPHRASSITTEDPHPPVQIFWGEEYIFPPSPPKNHPSIMMPKKRFSWVTPGWRCLATFCSRSVFTRSFFIGISTCEIPFINCLFTRYRQPPNTKQNNHVSLLCCSQSDDSTQEVASSCPRVQC